MNEITEWRSTDASKKGFIEYITYSRYVIAARSDESRAFIVDYNDENAAKIIVKTGMVDINTMTMDKKHKAIFFGDRVTNLLSIYQLPQFGCGLDPMIVSCNSVFFDDVTCVKNA